MRKAVLRANAIFLLVAATSGLGADLAGAFFGIGPQRAILGAAPHAAIGFVEAHGLAFIIGVRLWYADPSRAWHLTAAAVHALLGTCNLVFWQIFIVADALWGGYVTTALHGLFFVLQLVSARRATVREGAGLPAGG
jgi:hypothetical protein